MIITSPLPLLVVIIPTLTVLILTLVDEKQGLKLTAYGNLLSFLLSLFMISAVWQGKTYEYILDVGFYHINFAFFADSLSLLVGLAANFVWVIASFYSIEYMSHSRKLKRYNVFSMLTLTGMLGVVYTRNLFTLYLFFEMLSVGSYVMVIHEESKEARAAGLKYLFMGIFGGLVLFKAIIAVYVVAGTLDLVELMKLSGELGKHPWMPYIFTGLVLGFGVKAGLFPVHIWLPDAHPVAPAPASALLSGVMIKAGGYGIIRTIYNVVGVEFMRDQTVVKVLMVFAFVNIFLGSAMAIREKEIKKMLAYSSISQIGYVILGATLLTPSGIIGGAIHMLNHALIKGTLFMCAGAFIHQTGLRYLDDLKGISSRMPITMACFSIASLSMIGFPPFNGFVTKWFLAIGCLQTSDIGSYAFSIGMFALCMLLLSSLMNLIYYGPICYRGWFSKADKLPAKSVGAMAAKENDDPNLTMIIPMILITAMIVVFGIFPLLSVNLTSQFSQLIFH